MLSVAIAAARAELDGVVVPAANAVEAAQVDGLRVVGASTLAEVVGFLRGSWSPPDIPAVEPSASAGSDTDLREVRGQAVARRALEVAAAGGHNLLMVGSPGAGKTMLARRLATILPSPARDEALEATQLHSIAGILGREGVLRSRPFRAPHHSISLAGLLGGGSGYLRPGEVSLAHHGEASPHSMLPSNPGRHSRPVRAWFPDRCDPRPGVDSVNRWRFAASSSITCSSSWQT